VKSKYDSFGPAAFVADDDFLRHHLFPTEASTAFWEDYLHGNPNQKGNWQQARVLLEAVLAGLTSYSRTFISEEDEALLLERILLTNRSEVRESEVRPLHATIWYKIAAVACVVLATAVGGYFTMKSLGENSMSYESRISKLENTVKVTRHTNESSVPELYHLPDSSTVTLEPKSSLSFASGYGIEKRVVYLSGKALLDVVPDSQKPFFVYANEVVTKVLGTKFEVVAFDDGKDVTVKVLSGRVTVYRNDGKGDDQDVETRHSGILLLPNQVAVFNRNAEQFDKKLVEKPAQLIVGKDAPKFEYEDAYANQFFEDIKKAYGVNIVYNQEIMEHCQLSAALADESMMEKIDVVCKTIGATYEVIDAQIIISSSGCAP
jgi:transmembrane sensor